MNQGGRVGSLCEYSTKLTNPDQFGQTQRMETPGRGAPVTQHFPDEIGADGYGAKAAEGYGPRQAIVKGGQSIGGP